MVRPGSIFIQIYAVGFRRIFSATECVLAVQSRWRSSKVDDFGTNRKLVYDFLLVRHCDYGPILHRFWDTVTYWLKIAHFCYPSLLCSLWNFAVKFTMMKLPSWGYPQWRPHDRSWSCFDMVPDCKGQTDRRTDWRTECIIANTALCIATYADAL